MRTTTKKVATDERKKPLSSLTPPAQVFLGVVDSYAGGELSGWVYNRNAKVQNVSILLNSSELFTVGASLARPDVADAGLGTGECGFKFKLELHKIPRGDHCVEIVDSVSLIPLRNGIFLANRTGMSAIRSKDDVITRQDMLLIGEFLDLFQESQKHVTPSAITETLLECTDKLKHDEFVTTCYCLILGRTPDIAGYRTAQHNPLTSIEARKSYIDAMLESREFKENRSLSQLACAIHRTAEGLKYFATIAQG